ncbi:hypothetical protein [Notoacmeibacter ruber]|uniref:Uncharacterized protein n=1 Tax=Notoacmeibacter ruber TaxID=2670375 RepID=A0A3L7J315_9HYPH|nr:hypothetical protein [Notoacmeibacter ruber]RLQ84839.1 hypothetical protein D8780_15610 [Notoacmeibacter ruber]
MEFLDAYSIRARLFPAILTIAPAVALALLATDWTDPGLSEVVSTAGIAVLFFAAADLARRMGRRRERRLFAETGGKPYNTDLCHNNSTLVKGMRDRYRTFLAEKINQTPLSEDDERNNPQAARDFYDECFFWLRESTRDTERFKLLFHENVSYGFRRNLLGLKFVGILLNILVFVLAAAIVWLEPGFVSLSYGKLVFLAIFSLIHAMFFIFGVSKASVLDASRTYARQLILSTETLINSENKAD